MIVIDYVFTTGSQSQLQKLSWTSRRKMYILIIIFICINFITTTTTTTTTQRGNFFVTSSSSSSSSSPTVTTTFTPKSAINHLPISHQDDKSCIKKKKKKKTNMMKMKKKKKNKMNLSTNKLQSQLSSTIVTDSNTTTSVCDTSSISLSSIFQTVTNTKKEKKKSTLKSTTTTRVTGYGSIRHQSISINPEVQQQQQQQQSTEYKTSKRKNNNTTKTITTATKNVTGNNNNNNKNSVVVTKDSKKRQKNSKKQIQQKQIHLLSQQKIHSLKYKYYIRMIQYNDDNNNNRIDIDSADTRIKQIRNTGTSSDRKASSSSSPPTTVHEIHFKSILTYCQSTRNNKQQRDPQNQQSTLSSLLLVNSKTKTNIVRVRASSLTRNKDSHSSSNTTTTTTISNQNCLNDEEIQLLNSRSAMSASTQQQQQQLWYPIEGLFGIYTIPSGRIYVFIVQSDIVYTAPTLNNINNSTTTNGSTTSSSSWWTIRKVNQLHLVRVVHPTCANTTNNHHISVINQQEEERQVQLLRQALKQHEWYFCTKNSNTGDNNDKDYNINNDGIDVVINDMTTNLQQSILNLEKKYNTIKKKLEQLNTLAQQMKLQNPRQEQSILLKHSQKQQQQEKQSWLSMKATKFLNGLHYYDSIQNTICTNEILNETSIGSISKQNHQGTFTGLEANSIVKPWWSPDSSIGRAHKSSPGNADFFTLLNYSNVTDGSGGSLDDPYYQELRPDSRFFWNEDALEPFVQSLQSCIIQKQQQEQQEEQQHLELFNNDSNTNQPIKKRRRSSLLKSNIVAYSTLLQASIPVTSAFVGIQQSISIPSSIDDDDQSSIDSSSLSSSFSSNSSLCYYDEVIISRRSKYRAGTRYTRRGADATGAVANYAETEQLLFVWKKPVTQATTATTTETTKIVQNSNEQHTNDKILTAVASHVQVRGSIPLRWSSPTDIKTYRPRIRIGTDPIAQALALFNHLADQIQRYCIVDVPVNEQRQKHEQQLLNSTDDTECLQQSIKKNPSLVLVNLIDKTGDQGRLGRALDAVLHAVVDVYGSGSKYQYNASSSNTYLWLHPGTIQHIWYDFHAEVKSGRWYRLGTLLENVKSSLNAHGYFRAVPTVVESNSNGDEQILGIFPLQVEKLQKGVVRTNCMDCLDRTNVVQSIFGRYIAVQQIFGLKSIFTIPLRTKVAFRQSSMTIPWVTGEHSHRFLWADNADSISRLYAGTPALKGDFTRTGKRTKKGAFDDGKNSLQRYYLNNFLDADRQEGIDLVMGEANFNNLIDKNERVMTSNYDDEDTTDNCYNNDDETYRNGLSVTEAARYMLLGIGRIDDNNSKLNKASDKNHIRIKFNKDSRRKWNQLVKQNALDLRWLPGDLQNQFRSSTYTTKIQSIPDDYFASDALAAIDRRAASDAPWWVIDNPASSSYDNSKENIHKGINEPTGTSSVRLAKSISTSGNLNKRSNSNNNNNNAGYVLSALLAGTQAPVMMATVVLTLVAITLSPTSSISFNDYK